MPVKNTDQMQLVIYPAKILQHRVKDATMPYSQYTKMTDDMFKLMYKFEGIGLAANQVNINVRIFVMDIPIERENKKKLANIDDDNNVEAKNDKTFEPNELIKQKHTADANNGAHPKDQPPIEPLNEFPIIERPAQVVINPVIINAFEDIESEEGCLSIPEMKIIVNRYNKIDVQYYNLQGTKITETLTGIWAICFQHEFDHLNGKLIWDNLSPINRNIYKKKFLKSLEIKDNDVISLTG